MFAVEKIGGVARVKRKAFKAGEGSEDAGRPLPAVAEKIADPERALTGGGCTNGGGIPALKIEIAMLQTGSFVAPGILSFAVPSCIGSAMPLRFRRQALPCPARVGARFRVTDVHGPVERQGNLMEHRAVLPTINGAIPENRMRDVLLRLPRPGRVGPELAIFVAAGVDEIQKFAVRYRVLINGKRGHVNGVALKFVIPPEPTLIACQP